MKIINSVLIFLPFVIFSQTIQIPESHQKGIKSSSLMQTISSEITRAVIVGISNYQDNEITDLQFAHRDAEAFANFLLSPTGGKMDKDHIQLLTNQQATAGMVAAALDGLMDQSKKGDVVMIYFSGHGDVERKTISQPGFLLCWDAPSRIYMGGGTYPLSYLQEIITTLSIQKEVKVIVITDACHSGKLSGNQIGGAELTSSNLAKQYANEIKILSCQPNEFSIEGEQWGEGRGVFSYYLIDGLNGLADTNEDYNISLLELGRYLEDHITREVKPQSQNPIILGNKSESIVMVDSINLIEIKKLKSREITAFTATGNRGFEDEVLAKLDSNIVNKYLEFKLAIKNRNFVTPKDSCADDLYKILLEEEGLAPLHSYMRRNYAAALQDEAQQVMNNWMKMDVSELSLSKQLKFSKYKYYPFYLERAAELLGDNHYMYKTIKARMHYFEGYLIALTSRNPNKDIGEKALAQFREALEWESELPQAYWQMANVFGYNLLQPDSMEYYTNKVFQLYPNWILPLTDISIQLYSKYKKPDRAKYYLDLASNIDSSSIFVRHRLGNYYHLKHQYSEAERQFKSAIETNSNLIFAHHSLGSIYLDTRRYEEALSTFHRVIELDSTQAMTLHNLGIVYYHLKKYSEAIIYYNESIKADSDYMYNYYYLGLIYKETNRHDEAELQFRKVIDMDSNYLYSHFQLGQLYYLKNKYQEAEFQIKKVIHLSSSYYPAYNELGKIYLRTKRQEEAELQFEKTIHFDTTYADAYFNMACIKGKQMQFNIAFEYLEKALKNKFTDIHALYENSDLEGLRKNNKHWNRLIKKYIED